MWLQRSISGRTVALATAGCSCIGCQAVRQEGKSHLDLEYLLGLVSFSRRPSPEKSQSGGVGLNSQTWTPKGQSTSPRRSDVPAQRLLHFDGWPTLTCQFHGGLPNAKRLPDGRLQFLVEHPRDLRAVGLKCTSLELESGAMLYTLSSFPMNASIACTSSEGWWLVFRGNIWNDHTSWEGDSSKT